MRCSPLVRMTRSGSGMPAVSRKPANTSAVMASLFRSPRAAASAMLRAARTISSRPP